MSTDREQPIDGDRLAAVLDEVHTRQRKANNPLTAAQCNEARERRQAGESMSSIAAAYGKTPSGIAYHVYGECDCDSSVPPDEKGPHPTVSKRDCYELRARWRLGESAATIAETVPWCLDTVDKHVHGWVGQCTHRQRDREGQL